MPNFVEGCPSGNLRKRKSEPCMFYSAVSEFVGWPGTTSRADQHIVWAYAPFRRFRHDGLLRREKRPMSNAHSQSIHKASRKILLRAQDTIRRSRETLQRSREVQADRERNAISRQSVLDQAPDL